MSNPITQLQLAFELEPFSSTGGCPSSVEDIRLWISEKLRGRADLPVPVVPLNFGEVEPGPDARSFPWIRFDSQGRYMGIHQWSPIHSAWIAPGVVGELKTVVRSASTVAEDRADKGLVGGWELADTAPDLTGDAGFFNGSAPDWDRYTVIRV